ELSKSINISRQKGYVDALEHLETKTNLVNLISDFNEDGIVLDFVPFEYFRRYNRALTYSDKLVEDLEKNMPNVFHITKNGSEPSVLKVQPNVRCMLRTEDHSNQERKEQHLHSFHFPSLYDRGKDYYQRLYTNSHSRSHDKWEETGYNKRLRIDDCWKKNTNGPPWTNPYGSLPPSFQTERHQDEKTPWTNPYGNLPQNGYGRSYDDWNKYKYTPEQPLGNPYRGLSPSDRYCRNSSHHYTQFYNTQFYIQSYKEESRFTGQKSVDYEERSCPNNFGNYFDAFWTNNQHYRYYQQPPLQSQKHLNSCDISLPSPKTPIPVDNHKVMKCFEQNESTLSNSKDNNNDVKMVDTLKKTEPVKITESVKKNNLEEKKELTAKGEQTNLSLRKQINNRSRESGFEKYRKLVKNHHRIPFFIVREDAPNLSEVQRVAEIHFYKDGDIELLVEKIVFRVHKNILTLSSQFFNGMYQSATPSIEDLTAISNTGVSIPRVELRGDAAPDVEKLLSFLYPNTYFEISWRDVANLLRLADKYIVETLTTACVAFLKRSYQEEPLQALKLAETYQIASVYKESSKLVLDDFEKFFYEPRNLEGLSRSTQKKLKVQRQQYVEG
ncbi:4490_t:CDS:2, partial [Racocetra fulgida]